MSVEQYPEVVGEYDTVAKLLDGYSIARIGDGELKLMCGKGMRREPVVHEGLKWELRNVVTDPDPSCLPAIWAYNEASPKYMNHLRHQERFKSVLSPGVTYYSSFISRPDSAPWIERREYGLLMQRLWEGKRVAVVCERKGSIFYPVRLAARSCQHIECPTHYAYSRIDELEARVIEAKPDIAILSVGPTATCLAHRLARRGVQAIDLGSAGKFLMRLLKE